MKGPLLLEPPRLLTVPPFQSDDESRPRRPLRRSTNNYMDYNNMTPGITIQARSLTPLHGTHRTHIAAITPPLHKPLHVLSTSYLHPHALLLNPQPAAKCKHSTHTT